MKHARSLLAGLLAGLLATTSTVAQTQSGSTLKANAPKAPVATLAIDRHLATTREYAAGRPGFTVYRPADMGPFKERPLPLVVWSNGACRFNNNGVISFLTLLASSGFLVVANGGIDSPYEGGIGQHPEFLTESITWALNQSSWRRFIDPDKVVIAGRSCGGVDALMASADARVRTSVIVNSGYFPGPQRDLLAQLHAPTLFLHGGVTDTAYQNAIDNYNLVNVPAVLVGNARAGHNGLSLGIRDGGGNEQMMIDGTTAIVQWLDYILNGNQTAGRHLIGPDCTLCSLPDWSVSTRNF